MVKSVKQLSALTAICILVVSCSDFLGERTTTTYDLSGMVNSKESLESNILGCHKTLAGAGFKSGAFCEWLAPASGICHWGNTAALTNPLERWACCLKFTRFSKHPEAYDSFSSFYDAIYRCNSLLSALETSKVAKSYKTEIEGEALFLRAMAYFYLVRLYGDVTLHTEAPLTVDDVYGPRENFWVVYCQIVKDLTDAYPKMRDFDRMVEVAGGNASGRVCNYAAIACRSLVYLTIGSLLAHPDDNFWLPDQRTPDFSSIGIKSAEDAFRLSLADALDVIENGPFELCPDYRQLFRWTEPEDWQLKERIWAMPRTPESGDAGSGLTQWALPNYYNGTSKVENFGRCRPDRWFFQKWCEAFNGTQGPSGTVREGMYIDCQDPRMQVNLVYNSFIGKDKVVYNCYPAYNRIQITTTDLLKYYGMPFYKKYYDPTYDNSVGNSDLYVMRLAEVYLIAAEDYAWLGENDLAIKYVNRIRQRARKSTDGAESAEPHDLTSEEAGTQEELLNAIFWERCFEMPFEHHEYFDTHRYGAKWIVENISKPKNEFLYLKQQDDFTTGGKTYDGYRTVYYGRTFKYDEDWTLVRKGLISAYPNDELVYNPYLDINKYDPNYGQNPEAVFWR